MVLIDPTHPLTWGIIAFLGSGAIAVFLGSWKVFNVRKEDHEVIAKALTDVAEKLDTKIEEKHTTQQNAIDRVEASIKEDLSVLHGRVNRVTEDIGTVSAKVEYQRGVTDTMKEFILSGKLK